MDSLRVDGGFLDGGGATALRIAAMDWSAHPLGPMRDWPETLRVVLGLMLNSRFPKALAWGPEQTTFYNDAFVPILGDRPDPLGAPFREVWAEAWDEIGPFAEQALRGQPTFLEDFALLLNRFGKSEPAYFTFCLSPVRDPEGRVVGMMDTVIETTAKVETERQLAVQNAELAHRIRNTMAIVSGIARQTLREAESPDEAWRALSSRLGALAKTHELLTGGARAEARIDDVIRGALAPHVGEDARVVLDGPPIRLSEKKALSLSLAINELATNALKHGALSAEGGRVRIAWHTLRGEGGWLTWVERGGPPVVPPTRRSFGSVLLEQVVPQDFGGTGTLDYAAEGLSYRLTASA